MSDDDRDAILARRARFIAAAAIGIATAGAIASCDGDVIVDDDGDSAEGAVGAGGDSSARGSAKASSDGAGGTSPCLTPEPCLGAPIDRDAGFTGGAGGFSSTGGGEGGRPQPCLPFFPTSSGSK